MKYNTCDSRNTIVHSYHFRFLNLLKNLSWKKLGQNINLPWFSLQPLSSMSTKFQLGKPISLFELTLPSLNSCLQCSARTLHYNLVGNISQTLTIKYYHLARSHSHNQETRHNEKGLVTIRYALMLIIVIMMKLFESFELDQILIKLIREFCLFNQLRKEILKLFNF